MEFLNLNFSLVSSILPLAALLNLIIGALLYMNDRKAEVNRVFFFLTLSTVTWIVGVIVRFGAIEANTALIGARITFVGASLMGAFVFYVSGIFPHQLFYFTKYIKNAVIIVGISFGVLGLSTNTIVKAVVIVSGGQTTEYGFLYYAFAAYMLFFVLASIILLAFQYFRSSGLERSQAFLILLGIGLAAIIGVAANLIIPLLTGVSTFSRLGPLGTSFFIAFASYAITRRQLLNVKVIGTEVLVSATWIVVLIRAVTATTTAEIIINSILLVFWAFLGMLLVRSVLAEVKAREQIQKLATELEFANKELKRLDEAKSEFISIASHQLRTPLSIIKGYVSMIREGNYGPISEPTLKTINKIYLSNERLIKLVADLLDLSRMESGKLQYEFADFDFSGMVDSIVDEFKNPVHDKGLELKWTKPADALVIWGDSMKLRQVVFNLIDNSLKYTQKGSIEISLQKSNNTVAISVKDTGVGMTSETAHSLFQKFSRGKDSSKINTQGLGLGLFIAKKIVDDHHGELSITSEDEGKGSTFTLTLPIKKYVDPTEEFRQFMENV